jgi:hypothetical protein
VGDMNWYVFVCHVEVGDGKGAMVIVRCTDDLMIGKNYSMRNTSLSEQCPSLYMVEFTTPIQ